MSNNDDWKDFEFEYPENYEEIANACLKRLERDYMNVINSGITGDKISKHIEKETCVKGKDEGSGDDEDEKEEEDEEKCNNNQYEVLQECCDCVEDTHPKPETPEQWNNVEQNAAQETENNEEPKQLTDTINHQRWNNHINEIKNPDKIKEMLTRKTIPTPPWAKGWNDEDFIKKIKEMNNIIDI